MHTGPRRAFTLQVLGCCAIAALGGCQGWGEVEYAKPFPTQSRIGETINVQVVREGTRITITNTTANPIPDTTLWLNKWYSRPFERLDVGETVRYDLREFRDAFSEPFRAGGFWATDAGDPLVAAHLEENGTLVGLIVVSRRGG